MFIDKDNNPTILEFGSRPTFWGGGPTRFVLTKSGTLYCLKYIPEIFNMFPTGNIDKIVKKNRENCKVLEKGINTEKILAYIEEALGLSKSGFDGVIDIPQSYGKSNGCDGSHNSIEIMDEFRTKGHMLFAILLSIVPSVVLNGSGATKKNYKDLDPVELNKFNKYAECSILFINLLKLLYKECKNEESMTCILGLFPRSSSDIVRFSPVRFFLDGDNLLSGIEDIKKYSVSKEEK